MRLLYISNSTIPSHAANSIHVMKMCQALTQCGHEVTLLAPGKGKVDAELWTHYGITSPFTIVWIPFFSFFKRYDYAFRAALYARCHGFDGVISRHIPSSAFSVFLGLPTVCETHDPYKKGIARFLFVRMLKHARFVKLVVISQPLKAMILDAFAFCMRSDSVVVLPDAVDAERFDVLPDTRVVRAQLSLPLDRFTFGYVGHLYAGRGIELILSLASLKRDCMFVVIGGNAEDVARYRLQTQEMGLENVILYGFIPNSHLPIYFAACDALLMPYQRTVEVAGGGGNTSAWMSPLKLFEYLATGRPIISSDLPVLREIIDESSAILCAPEDISAWNDAAQSLIEDAALCTRLGEAAKRLSWQYTWKNRALEIARFY